MFVGDNNQPGEALNKKALAIITRVRDKLTGRDFSHEETLSVRRQVDLLIQQATNNENLCQCYIGWYVIIIFLITLDNIGNMFISLLKIVSNNI
jgi:phosphatidylinositol kinase/protein kinase (PI-3  family)